MHKLKVHKYHQLVWDDEITETAFDLLQSHLILSLILHSRQIIEPFELTSVVSEMFIFAAIEVVFYDLHD